MKPCRALVALAVTCACQAPLPPSLFNRSDSNPVMTGWFPTNVGGLHGMQQHPLIPLPGAAWTGMAGLLGLGAVKLLRNARRLLA